MTRIEFHLNVADKLLKIAELGERIAGRGQRLMVYAPDSEISSRLGNLLWTHTQTGFLPHCHGDDPLAPVTPIIIDWRDEHLVHDEVLINLQGRYPPFFSRFRCLIELVGINEADKAEARKRYRFYRDRGYEIQHFDLQGASP